MEEVLSGLDEVQKGVLGARATRISLSPKGVPKGVRTGSRRRFPKVGPEGVRKTGPEGSERRV